MTKFLDHMEAYARSDHDADRQSIEKQVWDDYGVEGSICIHDMSGFSRLTEKWGIVHYLSMVRHMQIVVKPIIERFDGHVVKFEADNCFARFPDAQNAVQSAISINIAFDAMNLMTTDDLNIYISTGIDHGKFLLIEEDDENDFFGGPVNVASKLGEDIGSAGDILLTQAAMDRVAPDAGIRNEPAEFEISGIKISACKIIY